MAAIMAANMAAIKTTKTSYLVNRLTNYAQILLICQLYDSTYVPFVGLQKIKMAAIMAANMAAITTTKPHNL